MILEAFANYLQSSDPKVPAQSVLIRWLWERLTSPAQNNVDRVLRSEVAMEPGCQGDAVYDDNAKYCFIPLSASGKSLLKTLYEYSMSYEQQKWARWVHCVKASDFNYLSKKD